MKLLLRSSIYRTMKIKLFSLIFSISFLLLGTSLFSQENAKFSLVLGTGINYGDANYGNELALEYLQNDDYNGIGASNDADLGFNFDVGLLYNLNDKAEIKISTGYLVIGTQVLGTLTDLRSDVTRPLSSEIPVRVEGRINHSMFNFGGDFIYNFNGNTSNGFQVSVGMSYLLHLNTNWNTDVVFETGDTGVQNKLSDVADTDLNDVIMTNLNLGYNIIMNENYRITPFFGINLGLNSFSDEDSLSPFLFSLGLRFNPLNL